MSEAFAAAEAVSVADLEPPAGTTTDPLDGLTV
jgi:hypothetical protein